MIVDFFCRVFVEGDLVVRAQIAGSAGPYLAFQRVREIRDGKLYLDDSKVPVRYPARLVIVHRQLGDYIKLHIEGSGDER